MSKVFRVMPKRIKRVNNTILTPEMVVTVTTQQHTTTPFYKEFGWLCQGNGTTD